MNIRMITGCLVLALMCTMALPLHAAELKLEKGDHIAIIGNALPDRMQHDGWLETYLYKAYPEMDLVIRNLGFTGDTVKKRPRNQNFITPDAILTHVQADVIFAMYGYNESYRQDPERFKRELRAFIKDTREQQYNGKSTPRLVLFSPIAHENLNSPNFPDGSKNNLWLSVYTDAMARVALEDGVPFVDLYAPSKALFDESNDNYTINGVHLNEEGNKALAKIIVEALGGEVKSRRTGRIREAVLDKNWCWFNRYRATDGNDVWGSRSTLAFTDGQTNGEVLQHELIMLDVMTANRDKVIWAAANGQSLEADDSNVPKPVPVISNFDPVAKNASLDRVPADEGVNTLKLENGMTANLFASEVEFPELVNPVQMDVDTQGRIWVAAWQTYPKWQPDMEMLDRLLILEDNDKDGVADKCKTFAFIHNPTGFTFWNGGVIVASAPNIWFLKDTDGDDVADHREIIFSGIDSADTHHAANNFDYGPDGYIYYQRGVFHVSNVETPWEANQMSTKTGMYRFNPRNHRFSFHADNSPNPHGGDFDYWGYQFATDATSGRAFQVRTDTNGKFKMHELLKKTVRPVPSSGILSSQHFPEKNNGNYIILNSIGFLGIKQYTLEYNVEEGSVWGTETDDILVSSDGNFRPADYKIGDDGALYVADWANPIVGHMQHNIRDPARDHQHGRIYRITVDGRPLQKSVKIDGEPIPVLLDILKHPVDGIRLRARTELSEHDPNLVIQEVEKWIQQFDGSKVEDAHHLLEALWLHQQFDVVNEGLLTLMLHSPEPHARNAAKRVQYMWELEGRLGDIPVMVMDHSMHEEEMGHDYLAQEMSPPPRMEGDTMVVTIQTVKEQMRYDRTKFAVKPGMKVKILLSNPDAMDHNMVFVQPGSASKIAMEATMLGAEGIKKEWLPENDNIFAASKLLSVGDSDVIEFTAPNKVGEYGYICTYPGHYPLMSGMMYVVNDLEAWAKDNPEETAGEAIGLVKEWTVADLEGDLKKLDKKGDAKKGEEVYKTASCAACHDANKDGLRVGPDLAKNAERLDPKALLVELIEPSKVIKEEYQAWLIELDSFEDVYGIIAEEDDKTMRIIDNPLNNADGVVIKKDEIASKRAAGISTMPTGLMNTFEKDQILDLMAYIRTL